MLNILLCHRKCKYKHWKKSILNILLFNLPLADASQVHDPSHKKLTAFTAEYIYPMWILLKVLQNSLFY